MSNGPSTVLEHGADQRRIVEADNTVDRQRTCGQLSQGRRYGRTSLALAVLLGMTAIWVVFFRPQALGGPVTYVEETSAQMAPAIPMGDVVAAKKQPTYKIGDVVLYRVPTAQPGATRIVVGRIAWNDGLQGFVIKGDNAAAPAPFHPHGIDIVGKVWFNFHRSLLLPLVAAFAAAFVGLAIAAWPSRRS